MGSSSNQMQRTGGLSLEARMGILAAMGALGGIAIGYHAAQHLFVEGLDDQERKTLLMVCGGMGLWAGLDYFFGLQKQMNEWTAQATQAVGVAVTGGVR